MPDEQLPTLESLRGAIPAEVYVRHLRSLREAVSHRDEMILNLERKVRQLAGQYVYDCPNFDEAYHGSRQEIAAQVEADIWSDFEWRKVDILRSDGTPAQVRVTVTIDDDGGTR